MEVRGLISGKRDVPLKGAGAVGDSRAAGSLGTSSGAGPGAWEGDAIGKLHVAAEGGAAGSITVTCGGGRNVASWTGAGAVGAIESSQGDRFSVAMEPAGSEIGLAVPGSGFVSLWAVSSCLLASGQTRGDGSGTGKKPGSPTEQDAAQDKTSRPEDGGLQGRPVRNEGSWGFLDFRGRRKWIRHSGSYLKTGIAPPRIGSAFQTHTLMPSRTFLKSKPIPRRLPWRNYLGRNRRMEDPLAGLVLTERKRR